jgi:PAS domain S-box-containing protein
MDADARTVVAMAAQRAGFTARRARAQCLPTVSLALLALTFGLHAFRTWSDSEEYVAAAMTLADAPSERLIAALTAPRAAARRQAVEQLRAAQGAQAATLADMLARQRASNFMLFGSAGLGLLLVTCVLVLLRRQHQAESALRLSEARMRLFIEHAPASLAMLDEHMRYLAVSRRWLADYALGERDLTGLSHYELFPEIGEAWREVHRRALAGETLTEQADRFVRADGSVQWLRWEVRPWRDERQQIRGIMIFTEDISELKRAHEDGREVSEWFHVAQAAAGAGTWQWNLHTDENIWSEEVWQLYGVPPGSATPSYRAWLDVVLDADREQVDRCVREAVALQADFTTEFRVRWPDGRVRHLLSRGAPFRDAAGQPEKYLGIVIDLTERKQSEEVERSAQQQAVLRQHSAQLASVIENVQDALALFDRDQQLVLCNRAYAELMRENRRDELLGRRRSELLEAWFARAVAPGHAQPTPYAALLQAGSVEQSATVDVRTNAGASLRITDRRIADGGVVETIWDLTEDEQRAEELRQAHAAAQAGSAAKTEFLSSISHELRTPMNAVLGFAQLLQRDRREPLTERQRERVVQILAAGDHLLCLINDILDLSRIEAGQIAIACEPVDVRATLRSVIRTLEPIAHKRGVQLSMAAATDEEPLALADPLRFAQVLMNFGTNAIKYNRPGGRVVYEVSLPRPAWLRVTVHDTGIGIPKHKQNLLFQPFQRIGQESGPIEGTGIGLMITKRLASLMSAELGYESEAGRGSSFWLDIPVVS